MTDRSKTLGDAFRKLNITVDAFWTSYLSMGGERLPANIEDLLRGEWEPSRAEYNLLAQALNEIHVDRGGNHPVPYWDN